MQLTRLRVIGFKSFVEPTDILIEPGLTAIIGPNGCGKSNLVEALRWVMGESSYKSMRASGMDDVIFAGSGGRASRNAAEVVVTIDNSDRTAPAAFNDSDLLEISRRIERESGSTYRINGREVRARDVQLLFADAATGARSAAMVRQGQISEIIAAKPQARRRILEDAAGIAGLHARRHEAELRLRAAEENLLRVEDVLGQIEGQTDSLKRQSRQAARYRAVSAEIRKLEAALRLIGLRDAREQAAQAAAEANALVARVAERAREQAEAARLQAIAAHATPGLREAEAAAAAALQRLVLARAELDNAESRAKEKTAALERRLVELDRDSARQEASRRDASATITRLRAEQESLSEGGEDTQAARDEATGRLETFETALAEAESAFNKVQSEASDLNARRGAFERAAREEGERAARFAREREDLEAQLAALADDAGMAALDALRAEAERLEGDCAIAEERASAAREALAAAREAEARARGPLAEAERRAQRLETEASTLAKIFAAPGEAGFAPILDSVAVEPGWEIALGAALGEDLDAGLDPKAPARWSILPRDGDPPLPAGATPLSERVDTPPELTRALAQIGVVERDAGAALQGALSPGQILVSREGDLWRWDGLARVADAPTAAARRLAERNRLGELERAAAQARDEADLLRRDLDFAQAAARAAAGAEAQSVEGARAARRAFDGQRERLATAERAAAERTARRSGLEEALARVARSEEDSRERAAQARGELAGLPPADALEQRLAQSRLAVAQARAEAAEARATLQTIVREAELAAARRRAVALEIGDWSERAENAAANLEELMERIETAREELDALRAAPDDFLQRRRRLMDEIATAEEARREAADRLAQGETALAETDRAARAALDALAAAREASAGAQARLEAMRAREEEIARAIAEDFGVDPSGLHTLAGLDPGRDPPDAAQTEARLSALRFDRERLGAVNLRAEDELREIEEKRDALTGERDDLVEAIKRLRQAVGSLNREGRERLLAAFEVVNGHFRNLFTTLFGGGEAELTLVDSDDPLEAGLEILARPPGKKPQIMTLLSGGEQALTATALIFAVFLTNPSPICVLDEVDAPLDDANVERYCDLLDEMARATRTRFIIITHNPITMARMDRLFGVTMAERGVSQLVSVDLERAERLAEAG
ncbi:MAG: chromosome segregation protein SMC [Salinarimonadaceae bacterium]|nr:MAG: chromosome segregation protein SMC [Salinarimonadaceae bacterium]